MQKRMLKDCRIGLFLGALLFALAGCADKKDGSASCMNQLNAEQYQSVAENTNCSNYERASGYLGMAGMSFSNFMKKGATDNLTKTLTISKLDNASDYSTGTRNYITKALCLVGPDNITSSSRCTGLTASVSRGVPEREISFFSLLGDMIYVNYGVLDNDSNGTITSAETSSFSSMESSATTTIYTDNITYEIIAGTSVYIASDNFTSSILTSKCLAYSDNYTAVPTDSDLSCNSISNLASAEIRPIYKVDNMTDISGGSVGDSITAMVSEFSSLSLNLDSELEAIGLKSDSSLRKSLTEGLSKIDNGGLNSSGDNCSAAKVFDTVALLVKDAADNTTTSAELKNKNLVSFSDLIGSVDSSINKPTMPSGYSGVTIDKARFIWDSNSSDNSSWTDFYNNAYSDANDLKSTITNIRKFGTTTSTKGDGKVIFRELICIGEN